MQYIQVQSLAWCRWPPGTQLMCPDWSVNALDFESAEDKDFEKVFVGSMEIASAEGSACFYRSLGDIPVEEVMGRIRQDRPEWHQPSSPFYQERYEEIYQDFAYVYWDNMEGTVCIFTNTPCYKSTWLTGRFGEFRGPEFSQIWDVVSDTEVFILTYPLLRTITKSLIPDRPLENLGALLTEKLLLLGDL
jgi:hypothetical protein